MGDVNPILFLVLGWLLGLLGGPITEAIGRLHRSKRLKRACYVELDELRYTMSADAVALHTRLGTLNHPLLEWCELIESEYDGPDKDPHKARLLETLTATSPEQLASAMAVEKAKSEGVHVKQHSVPFLESRLPDISILPVELQQALHQVRSQLDLFNQTAVLLERQLELTYSPGMNDENQARVRKNIAIYTEKLAERAKVVADAISYVMRAHPE